jgi:hypothetical protein
MLLAGRAEAEAAAGDRADGIPPVPPKASEAGFDYLFRRFQAMCRMPVVHLDDCDLGEEGANEPQATAATREQPVAAADADSDSDEANAESATGTAPVPSPGAKSETQTQAETPAAAPHRPMTKRARKLREKRLREAAKREARKARMAR